MSSKWLTVSVAFWMPVAMLTAQPNAKQTAASRAAREAQQKAATQAENAAAKQNARAQTQATRQEVQAAQQALNPPKLPGGLTLQRLAEMPPEERAGVLSKLPPARQQQIEKRLEVYREIPPAARARAEGLAERLKAMPPEKADEVRQAVMEFRNVDPPRKTVIFRELNRLSTMTDEQRATYMSGPAFRSRFSESEIHMMSNLREIIP